MDRVKIISNLKIAAGLIDEVTVAMESLQPPQTPVDEAVPMTEWEQWIKALAEEPSIPNGAKPAILAQSIIETGRGTSYLFKMHRNPLGMKWRDEMKGFAVPKNVPVTSEPSGYGTFCAFESPEAAAKGWYRFIERSPYAGWTAHVSHPRNFLKFVCIIWAADTNYLDKCLSVLSEAEGLLKAVGWVPLYKEPAPTTPENGEPRVDARYDSPNQSARGSTIRRIIIHNTDGSFAGSVSWHRNPAARVSAHLIIGRDGTTAQMVPFNRKAWHAGNANGDSIGIEITADENHRGFTPEMEARVVAWCRYLMQRYDIQPANIGIHRWFGQTDCPGWVFPTDEAFRAWRKRHFGA